MSAQNNGATGWVGWVFFASIMMMLVGIFGAIEGLVALFKPSYYAVGEQALVVSSYTTYGWVNLVLGIIIFLAGLEVMRGAVWARAVGIILAAFSFFANLSFVNAYPIWSIAIMVIDVLVIYALAVHGDELRN
ncbi:hypothetical protein KW803_01585 [Candidatus Saccharibacteria bacterium]|nr:hypothetical protein [Candidatus Saccharibacteria bacterium]